MYNFLTNEFFSNPNLLQIVRRTQTVFVLMNTLKTHYWIKPSQEDAQKANEQQAPTKHLDRPVVVHIRTGILQLVDQFMFRLPADLDEKDVERDEEFQCILNFISSVQEVKKFILIFIYLKTKFLIILG